MDHPLVLPMVAHLVWTAGLYALLTVARARPVWGTGPDWSDLEPRISANLSNQFEWPLFFYVACVLLLQSPPSTSAVMIAWVFIAGRVLHTAVQILTTNIRLRGLVFLVNFLAVLALWSVLIA